MFDSDFDPNGLPDEPNALDTEEFVDDATVLLLLPNNGLVWVCDVVPTPNGDVAVPVLDAAPNGPDEDRDVSVLRPLAP